jgi:hypothetical protein
LVRYGAELDRIATPLNGLPEVKKQNLLADVRAIAVKWHPFSAEIQSALASPGSPSRPPALMRDKTMAPRGALQSFRDPTNVVRIGAFAEFS